MSWLALDIGGANLKAADGCGYAEAQRFPLWQHPHRLADALRTIIADAPPSDHIAATMTGELADCFRTKTEGVRQILEALSTAVDHRHTRVYLSDGRLVTPPVALRIPRIAAASNWHALARFAGRYAPSGGALLIDIGSTTTDIVPLVDGKPAATGQNDPQRMIAGELVYTGIERSPVCAVADQLPWRGESCPTAHEVFATMWDVYVLLGDLPERPKETATADGRPVTRRGALERLARSICADREMFDARDAERAARAAEQAQLDRLESAARRVLEKLPQAPRTMIVSGRGEFLARRLLQRLGHSAAVVSLAEQLGPTVSRCATAHALAVLAREGVS